MAFTDDEPVRGGYPSIEFLALSGVERMRAAAKGQMPRPPIHHLCGLTPVSSTVASSLFTMPTSPWLQTAAGVFLAGTSALVADAPLGSAILGPLGSGQYVVTSDLTLNYLRPVTTRSGHLAARARPIEVGRRLGLAEAVIEDGSGELVAHATTRCFIREIDVPDHLEPATVEHPRYDTPDPHERPFRGDLIDARVWAEKSFIEIVDAMNAGELAHPPFARLFRISDVAAKEGYFESSAPSSPWFSSPAGTIYGGFIAYYLDSALTGAIGTLIPPTAAPASLDLKVSFLRPVMPDGRPLRARAEVVHRGKTFVVAEGEILNEDEKVVAKGISSATILEGRSWSTAVVDHAPDA